EGIDETFIREDSDPELDTLRDAFESCLDPQRQKEQRNLVVQLRQRRPRVVLGAEGADRRCKLIRQPATSLGRRGNVATCTFERGVELTQAFSVGAVVWLCPSRKLAPRQLRLLESRA